MRDPDSYADLVPVYSRTGASLGWVSSSRAAAMVDRGEATALGTKTRVRSIRLHADPPHRVLTLRRVPQRGDAHRRETYTNPRGTWTHDFLPSDTRDIYIAVLLDCLPKAA